MHFVEPVIKVKDGPQCIFTLRGDHILYDGEREGVVADLLVQVAVINYQPPFPPGVGDDKGPRAPHRVRLLQEAPGDKLIHEFAEGDVSYAECLVWHTFLRLLDGGFKRYDMHHVRPEVPTDVLNGSMLKLFLLEGLLQVGPYLCTAGVLLVRLYRRLH